MTTHRGWMSYPLTYCAREMEILAAWIHKGQSGAVVGPPGVGKSNLLGFLCHRPDALALYLDTTSHPVALIFIDLNDLPVFDVATLYRVILRAFYECRQQFTPLLRQTVTTTYQETRTLNDPFTVQTALRELLFLFQEQSVQVVMVWDRFDHFCQKAAPPMTDTLRALRDGFKQTLCYLVGMRQEIAYLSDPTILGERYEILDAQVCRVRPLTATDAQHLVTRELHASPHPLDQASFEHLLALTGGYPAWLKIACTWWLNTPPTPFSEWLKSLLAEHTIQYRLGELWAGLSQKEQLALAEVGSGLKNAAAFPLNLAQQSKKTGPQSDNLLQQVEHQQQTLTLLENKGLIRKDGSEWRIFSELLAAYIAGLVGRGRGQIWLNPNTGNIYQGQTVLANLAPLERSLLTYLLTHPRIRHTYTTLIQAAWPDEINKEGVTNEALFQVVTGLRRKIEPDPARPCYLVNWRGIPEGGYQCFPEGRPE